MIYIYKLKRLFNKRANPIDNDIVLFERCDDEFNEIISLKTENNSEFSLHRWYECLNEKKYHVIFIVINRMILSIVFFAYYQMFFR
ncbi:hypothetical protein XBKB1_1960002 [Xenorhabdus bovienii str. kraussei Becker Underwood]|uniref:Uncharacterized protein n=1 Tax=Xenorhabdus bovienii str. kraussei Becker Underwood TaxID=1398204 RepID=A0A077PH90_XENBV|nr:hypothetical protein XBKB1_1960002 [Xenorhabdus bovienii str. kraussei Becker Underwood]